MKKLIALLMVLILVAGCGPKPPTPEPAVAAPTEQPAEPPAMEAPTEVPSPTPQPFYQDYGVHIHPDWGIKYDPEYDKNQVDRACEVGAKWIRIGVTWRLQERQPDEWDEGWYLPELDKLVDYTNSKGLKILLMLAETPCWASSDPNKICSDEVESYNKWYPPSDPGSYAVAFGFLVQRYGDQIAAWEVWNEPNMSQFWGGPPDAEIYTEMLQASYRQAKYFNPDAIVLGGSIAGADVEYLKAMYTTGAKGYFDALALHPYSGTQSPEGCTDPRWSYQCGVEAVREVMLAHEDDKPIWFTEIGWSSLEGSGGVGEKQVEYLGQAFTIALGWDYVPVIIWYDLVDDSKDHPNNREGYFGLFDQDLNPKPAAEAFREASEK